MARNITASDRRRLIKLASTLPKGSPSARPSLPDWPPIWWMLT